MIDFDEAVKRAKMEHGLWKFMAERARQNTA